jgi:asparagine synthase (glutamine-hydrolysing)
MCGIFGILNCDSISDEFITTQFEKGKRRGPEYSKLSRFLSSKLGFHRLAINGLDEESNQPLITEHVVLICNGEIYNHKYLFELMDLNPSTGSDCEVISHLYMRYGIEQTLQMMDGVFAFILYDLKESKMFVARDPFGVRPLYHLSKLSNYSLIGFASNLASLTDFVTLNNEIDDFNSSLAPNTTREVEQFTPGTYSVFQYNKYIWVEEQKNIVYYSMHAPSSTKTFTWQLYYDNISYLLCESIKKRCLNTERPIACLLSGGLDSSLVTALVNEYYLSSNLGEKKPPLETYSIGLEGSIDLKYAKIVAEYLKTKHTEVIVTEREMFEAIPEVIQAIESYDTTTVRASIGNYLVGKYISQNSQAKVIFNGDGADELCGGYLYMKGCPDSIEFDKETRRLLKDIHLFDVLRSDKSISSHGLEPRTPFLDKNFVNYFLSIPPYVRNYTNYTHPEKYLIRRSFCHYENFNGNRLLPHEIIFRKKEAFSDGVAGQNGRSLFQILQEFISLDLNMPACIETEKFYYKSIFEKCFPRVSYIVPYMWMPKYTDNATDPSARTLSTYHHST